VNTEKFNETGVRLARNWVREADYPFLLNQQFFAKQLWTTQMEGIIRSYIVSVLGFLWVLILLDF
jgi:hypothetical protein